MNKAGCGLVLGIFALLIGLIAFGAMFGKNGASSIPAFLICAGTVTWVILAYRRDKKARASFLARNEQILTRIENLPKLPVINSNGLALGNGELYYLQTRAVGFAPSMRYVQQGGFGGVSVPISDLGFSVTLGRYRGKMTPVTELQSVGLGTLYLTNARIVFVASHQTVVIELANIVSIDPLEDGVTVRSANAPAWTFQTGNVEAAAIMYRLVHS
jgi:hypothetical protein